MGRIKSVLRHIAALAAVASIVVPGAVLAQRSPAEGYPSKPVTVVYPFVAGGPGDNEFRLYADKLQASLGQAFVLDFKPGAAATIGASYVLKAAPDGYTLLVTNAGITVFPNFYPALNENVIKSLAAVTEFSKGYTGVLVSQAALPNVQSLQDLLAYGKANPGALNCNTAGAGGITHTVCAALATALNLKITPVHYKGVAQGQVDLVAGRTQVSGGTLFAAMPNIKAGKVRVIAILGPERAPLMPDTRTSHEQGYNVDFPVWLGAFAPPGTPQPIVDKLSAEFAKVVRLPDVVRQLETLGNAPVASTPAVFRAKVASELAYWKRIIQENDIKAEN